MLESTAQVPCNLGVVRSVMTAGLHSQQHHQSYCTKRKVSLADGSEPTDLEYVDKVTATVRRLTHALSFVVKYDVPFNHIFGRPSKKTLQAAVDL